MTKKGVFAAMAVAAACAAALLGTSCKQEKSATAVTATSEEIAALPIAYVRMDSVLAEYKYSIEIQEKLQADAAASEKQLQGRAAAFQKEAEDFERRARINAFVTQEAAQAAQNKVLKLQQDAAALQQELAQKLSQKQALMQEDLMKDIQARLKEFNGGRYKLILTNLGVLYADEALDITEEFIQHLNESYAADSGSVAPADSTSKK